MAVLTAADPGLQLALEQLQGSWTTVAGPRQARLLIAGHRYTFEFVSGDLYMGSFDLAGHGEIDMHIEEGPEDHAGRISRCIFRVEGGILRWCPGAPGSDRRPSTFPDVDDTRYLSLVFRRARAADRR